jgi:tyrosyl-tRNA synthetase
MVGRDLQRAAGQEPQIALTMPILRGLDGHRKMGKSLNNYIGVGESTKEQFGKTMSIPDSYEEEVDGKKVTRSLLAEWFELLTDRPAAEIRELLAGHPMEAKKTLAGDIVRFYHGAEAAATARREWEQQFSKGKDPDQIDEVKLPAAEVPGGELPVVKLLTLTGLCKSGNEARQKVTEGAFNYGPDRTRPADAKATVPVTDGLVLRLGRKIVRVRLG